jgi:hypothetical protein
MQRSEVSKRVKDGRAQQEVEKKVEAQSDEGAAKQAGIRVRWLRPFTGKRSIAYAAGV